MVLPSRPSSRGAIGFGVTFGAYPTGLSAEILSNPLLLSGMWCPPVFAINRAAATQKSLSAASFTLCEVPHVGQGDRLLEDERVGEFESTVGGRRMREHSPD